MAFGVTNVATQGVDYYGLVEGNWYPGGAPPWGIYDSELLSFVFPTYRSRISFKYLMKVRPETGLLTSVDDVAQCKPS